MRPVAPLLSTLILAAVLAGCNGGRQEGNFYTQGSVSMPGSYYAELFDPERKRWYLFFTEETAAGFQRGDREMPLSKTLIGVGPGRTTVVLEQLKDADQNAIRGERVLALFRERHPQTAAAPMAAPAPVAAPAPAATAATAAAAN